MPFKILSSFFPVSFQTHTSITVAYAPLTLLRIFSRYDMIHKEREPSSSKRGQSRAGFKQRTIGASNSIAVPLQSKNMGEASPSLANGGQRFCHVARGSRCYRRRHLSALGPRRPSKGERYYPFWPIIPRLAVKRIARRIRSLGMRDVVGPDQRRLQAHTDLG